MNVTLALMAAALLTVAGYAQYRIPFHTAGQSKILLLRGVLILVGIGPGYVAAAYYADPANAVLAFMSGFGMVHAPAAIILFLKRARGEGRS